MILSSYTQDCIFASYLMKKVLRVLFALILLAAVVVGIIGYSYIYKDNLINTEDGKHSIYVKKGWSYDSLTTELFPYLIDFKSFDLLARKMNLPNKVIPGLYELPDSFGNRKLIQYLRSGQTTDVKVVLNGSLKRSQILPKISENLAIDSTDLETLMTNKSFLDSIGYNQENWPCLFVANTYFFNWASDAETVINRFINEHKRFWNEARRNKAARIDLTPNEVIILASIVDAETMKSDELPKIAGVYLNRLQQDWPLGADPTIRYLIGEEGRQRVLYADLEIESPYNTYKNLGLPPGPVLLPSAKAIDAVLNASNTEYMYFCAKADFSGYHAFAKTNAQHERNRRAYTQELNRRGIMR